MSSVSSGLMRGSSIQAQRKWTSQYQYELRLILGSTIQGKYLAMPAICALLHLRMYSIASPQVEGLGHLYSCLSIWLISNPLGTKR